VRYSQKSIIILLNLVPDWRRKKYQVNLLINFKELLTTHEKQRTLALLLALAISTMLSGILAIHTTAVFAQGNVTQAGN
jgi:hypothetical protein